jgi:hypothetical protein
VRIRAGGLITSETCPAHVRESDILQPVVRRNDRLGEPLEGGAQVVPWSFLTITGREGTTLKCQIHSGMPSLLQVRASARTVKLALVGKPLWEHTELQLRTRGDPPQPLAGYEIHAKNPVTEKSTRIGRSDWRGVISIPRADMPLEVLYVRNGAQLLARLPIVPGLNAHLVAEVRNDDRRLEAEGYLKGVQSNIMDLVARRELYISRFRRHLKQKELDPARALLEQFRTLSNRSDLLRELTQQEQRFASPDPREQTKIDQLFKDMRQLLSRFLDPGTANQLAAELDAARRPG